MQRLLFCIGGLHLTWHMQDPGQPKEALFGWWGQDSSGLNDPAPGIPVSHNHFLYVGSNHGLLVSGKVVPSNCSFMTTRVFMHIKCVSYLWSEKKNILRILYVKCSSFWSAELECQKKGKIIGRTLKTQALLYWLFPLWNPLGLGGGGVLWVILCSDVNFVYLKKALCLWRHWFIKTGCLKAKSHIMPLELISSNGSWYFEVWKVYSPLIIWQNCKQFSLVFQMVWYFLNL